MTDFEIIKRTKHAVRIWADLAPPNDGVLLDDPLNQFRPASQRNMLRPPINDEFAGESHFPIDSTSWNREQGKWETVRDLRDFVKKTIGG